jgi:hypothetical protein
MDNTIVTTSIIQNIKDRIKETFIGLVPDDKWEEMVKTDLDAFFTLMPVKYTKTSGYNGSYSSSSPNVVTLTEERMESPFRAMVFEACYTRLAETLKEKVMMDYFTSKWTNGEYEIHETMKKIVEEAAPKALINLMEAISFSQVNQLRTQLQNFR